MYKNPLDEMSLAAKSRKILGRINVPPIQIERLVRSYYDSKRGYHGATHPVKMLENLRLIPLVDEGVRHRVEYLILFHDAFYQVGLPEGTNERTSGEWGVAAIEASDSPESICLSRLMMQGCEATINHTLDGVDECFRPEVSLLLDLDLWSLGADSKVFDKNTEEIWYEVKQIKSRNQFYKDMAGWAQAFLDREYIYHTHLVSHRESQARRNLHRLARRPYLRVVK